MALGRQRKKADGIYTHFKHMHTQQHYSFFKDMHKPKISTAYHRMVAYRGEGQGNFGAGPKENKEEKARGREERDLGREGGRAGFAKINTENCCWRNRNNSTIDLRAPKQRERVT